MARKRTIDPDIWEDESVNDLSLPAVLFYIGLISHADDDGRLEWRPKQLRLKIVPGRPEANVAAVEGWMAEIERVGLIRTYEVDGHRYGWHPNWSKHQYVNKRQASKIPPHPDDFGSKKANKQPEPTATVPEQATPVPPQLTPATCPDATIPVLVAEQEDTAPLPVPSCPVPSVSVSVSESVSVSVSDSEELETDVSSGAASPTEPTKVASIVPRQGKLPAPPSPETIRSTEIIRALWAVVQPVVGNATTAKKWGGENREAARAIASAPAGFSDEQILAAYERATKRLGEPVYTVHLVHQQLVREAAGVRDIRSNGPPTGYRRGGRVPFALERPYED